MTDADKIVMIKDVLEGGENLPSDAKLTSYLRLAKIGILNRMYEMVGGVPVDVEDVPAKYELTQIYAVIAGYSHEGAEGEKTHNENGINRVFSNADMNDYIREHVMPYARVGAVVST